MSALNTTPVGWERYQPSADDPWSPRKVVHLHRRAAFGVTPQQLTVALDQGLETILDSLLDGKVNFPLTSGIDVSSLLAESAVSLQNPTKLKAAWISRMLNTNDPLREQLTLMWHNHFATGYYKVKEVDAMWKQNELFRELSRAPFGKLLHAVLRDEAMLIWLDAASNTKKAPNENLARELMELFTLGIGNYDETDVKEAARALSGRTLQNGKSIDDPSQHDGGVKLILGREGAFGPDDLAGVLIANPATSRRLAWRICEHFVGEDVTDSERIDSLATELRRQNLNIDWAVRTVLASKFFFSDEVVGSRVTPPVVFATASVRALDSSAKRPPPAVISDWISEAGQDLFNPPNVAGWKGGRNWISSQRYIARVRYAKHFEPSKEAASGQVDLNSLETILLSQGLDKRDRANLTNADSFPVSALLSLPAAQLD